MEEGQGSGSEVQVKAKRPYYRPTSVDQRKLLFGVYEETVKAKVPAARAHVGTSTFYYWLPRFQAGGYEALAPLAWTIHEVA